MLADVADDLRRPDGSPARLLVVDDEQVLVDLLSDALRFAGYEVVAARTGREALKVASDARPDLVILDVNLPDLDGFEVIRRLRRDGNAVPVVFLTARDDPDDLRAGFGGGGDDYITKPFSLEELNLRVQAVLRRSLAPNAVPSGRLACAGLVMDEDAHRVWRGDEELSLSPTEFRLLRYLLQNKGRVVSKDQILERVWEYDFGGEGTVVETYISYLRRKVDRDRPPLIHTVRGVGYTLRPPAD
jgi:two-component system OmpR family response regulator